MKMFKKGDRVRFVGDDHNYHNESGFLKSYKGMQVGEHRWTMEFNFIWLVDLEVFERELELVYRKPDEFDECQCGAHATSFKNFHSDWCPMYKDMK